MADTPQVYELSNVALVLRATDEVAVVKAPLKRGDELHWAGGSLRVSSDIKPGHKIALKAVAQGTPVHKYGQITAINSLAIYRAAAYSPIK